MTAQEIVEAYDALVDHAKSVCDALYKYASVDRNNAHLRLGDEEAQLYAPQAERDYDDGCTLEWETNEFPLWLLNVPLEEAVAWATEERKRRIAEEDAKRLLARQEQLNNQKAEMYRQYVQLKGIFEGKSNG